jgi:rhodanese-related sulfurtransferase
MTRWTWLVVWPTFLYLSWCWLLVLLQMRGLVDTPLANLIAMGERLGINTAVVVRPVELSTLGLGPFIWLSRQACWYCQWWWLYLLTSLEGVVDMSLDDLSAMGWKLSFQTVVVVWQSLWCSKSVAKVLREQHCLYLHWCWLFLLTSLGGLLYMPLDDLIAMGQKLSLLTAVVVWQLLWCSKSVAKVLLEWGILHCLCLQLCWLFLLTS